MSRSTNRLFFSPVAITLGSKRPMSRLLAAGILVAMALIARPASAATDTWTGNTDDTWNTAGNWSGTNLPPSSGDSLIFTSAAGNGGLDLNDDWTSGSFNIAGITFQSGSGPFVIGDGTAIDTNAGNAFTLTGGITNSSTSLQTINDPFAISGSQTFTTTRGAETSRSAATSAAAAASRSPAAAR